MPPDYSCDGTADWWEKFWIFAAKSCDWFGLFDKIESIVGEHFSFPSLLQDDTVNCL